MSSISVTRAPSGLVHIEVLRSERITPHVVRVTLGGADLAQSEFKGFDQWFRLAVPKHGHDRFDGLPERFGIGGFLNYSALPRSSTPVIRDYTVRQPRPDPLELNIDFVAHGPTASQARGPPRCNQRLHGSVIRGNLLAAPKAA